MSKSTLSWQSTPDYTVDGISLGNDYVATTPRGQQIKVSENSHGYVSVSIDGKSVEGAARSAIANDFRSAMKDPLTHLK